MNTIKTCPTCNTKKAVAIGHEFEKLNERRELTLELVSQSASIDGADMELLFPVENDGQDLVVDAVRVDDRTVRIKLYRRVRGQGATVAKSAVSSREDLETQAVEMGIVVKANWSRTQLVAAIEEQRAAKVQDLKITKG